jgi:hypothetical protein
MVQIKSKFFAPFFSPVRVNTFFGRGLEPLRPYQRWPRDVKGYHRSAYTYMYISRDARRIQIQKKKDDNIDLCSRAKGRSQPSLKNNVEYTFNMSNEQLK